MKKSKEYEAGDLITIHTKKGFTIGLIAREYKEKILCYFFNFCYTDLPNIEDVILDNHNILFVKICSDLGVKKGQWKIIGKYKNWKKENWRIPIFIRKDLIAEEYFQITYNDCLVEIDSKEIEYESSLENYPEDGLAGYGYIEKKIELLL
jgi:hypothetical protein